MKLKGALPAVIGLLLCTTASAQTEYVLTDFPVAAMAIDTIVTVRWTGIAREGMPVPDSGYIYYSKTPGGMSLKNRHKVVVKENTLKVFDNQLIAGADQRQISFRPSNQSEMGPGKYYYVVAWPVLHPQTGTAVDTFFSNELQLIVETDQPTELLAPTDTITDLTPTFSWDVNPGVPYYHLILSDEKIGVDSATGEYKIQGLSIVWQAITPNTQIVYGAPDPSGTLTADPPPMSPGATYSVVVLNNYGNHPAYTSTKFGLPKTFTIAGDTLKRPVNIYPIGDTLSDSTITFKWTNLDKQRANTYKVYAYIASPFEEVDAQMVAWQNEITAGTFANTDTASMTIDARKIFTKNHYTWKVIACDERGAGSAGDTTSFDYTSPTGRMRIITLEEIPTSDKTLTKEVAAVEIKVEVVDGSMEKPLLFYTDNKGLLSRDRPVGTYRITASKEGFEELTRTVTVVENETTTDSLVLQRPDATIFGSLVNEAGVGIDLGTVTAVSELNDTVYAETDRYGSFVLSCYAADWQVWGKKSGYITSTPREVTIAYGQSFDLGPDTLARVPFTVSGVVQNTKGQPMIGAKVAILQDGAVVGELPSSSQDGTFSFSVEAGEYVLRATKTGFTSAEKNLQVASSQSIALEMSPGAAMVTGYVIGRTWVNGDTVRAPITGAEVFFSRLSGGTRVDTVSVVTDNTYGNYTISLTGGDTYEYWSRADGFAPDTDVQVLPTSPGVTISADDLLKGYATVNGSVVLVDKNTNAVLDPAGGVTVSLMDDNKLVASSKSSALGDFELRSIPDGNYLLRAGKDGLALKTISPGTGLDVSDGRPSTVTFSIEMVAGDRRVKWDVRNAEGTNVDASVKVQSPLRKTLESTDSLQNAGSGVYVVAVDATVDTLIDLAYHTFTVDTAAADSIHIDSVRLPISYRAPDTLKFSDDSLTIGLKSGSVLDSVALYYRISTASSYHRTVLSEDTTEYRFRILPRGDGRDLVYYFEAHAGTDIYGYSGESFRSYVEPSRKISKMVITPGSGDDTLRLPVDYQMRFRLNSYYSSAFYPKTDLDSMAIVWTLENAEKSRLRGDAKGMSVVVETGTEDETAGPVRLIATIDGNLVRPGVDSFAVVNFTVSNQALDSIAIRRTDAGDPNPITTSPGDRAEFSATGFDSSGSRLSISPLWVVEPAGAGEMDENGVFTPAPSYAGYARIHANAGEVKAEYRPDQKNPSMSGLMVRHILTHSSSTDTIQSRTGCRIVFPPEVIGEEETALFELITPVLTNPLELKGDSSFHMVGNAYDINEVNGVTFSVTPEDSIRLTLDIPEGYGSRAADENGNFVIGYWNPDSLIWKLLKNSTVSVSDSDTIITASVSHFSRYAVMLGPKRSVQELQIRPNPFSPYIAPVKVDPTRSTGGTRISFELKEQVEDVEIRVYNVLGDVVWAVYGKGLQQGQHSVWWNGKTTDGEVSIQEWVADGESAGRRMCRNGRYFVILTITNMSEKKTREIKPVILMK